VEPRTSFSGSFTGSGSGVGDGNTGGDGTSFSLAMVETYEQKNRRRREEQEAAAASFAADGGDNAINNMSPEQKRKRRQLPAVTPGMVSIPRNPATEASEASQQAYKNALLPSSNQPAVSCACACVSLFFIGSLFVHLSSF
jgi:hypothetical protein